MEYQKERNLLDNTPNQPSKFRTKIRLEQMMKNVEFTVTLVKLNVKLQC